jgi:hypothetical protein
LTHISFQVFTINLQVFTDMVEAGIEEKVLRPKSMSETKFANYIQQVYSRFRTIIPPLLTTLEEVKQDYTDSRDNENSKKAQKADAVMGKVYNVTFLLTLSALVDIYKVLSVVTNAFQVVDCMVFERKDVFDRQLRALDNMLNFKEVTDCACSILYDYSNGVYAEGEEETASEVCEWKVLHGDIRELKESSTYRGVVIGCLVEDGSKTRVGRKLNKSNQLIDFDKVIKTVTERAASTARFLLDGLSANVYSETEATIIENIRRLLDLRTLSNIVQLHGPATVSSSRYRSFVDAARFLAKAKDQDLFNKVNADELRIQYRTFVDRLSKLQLGDKGNTEIFSLFLDPRRDDLYK